MRGRNAWLALGVLWLAILPALAQANQAAPKKVPATTDLSGNDSFPD